MGDGDADNQHVLWNHYQDVILPSEHNPPHFHAYYQGYKAIIDIMQGEIIESDLPTKQVKLVVAWATLHQDELLANWNLASNGELPFKIDPLA
jgi:hypothetical protein